MQSPREQSSRCQNYGHSWYSGSGNDCPTVSTGCEATAWPAHEEAIAVQLHPNWMYETVEVAVKSLACEWPHEIRGEVNGWRMTATLQGVEKRGLYYYGSYKVQNKW